MECDVELFRLFKVLYLVFFCSLGVIFPTFPVFYEVVDGFSKYQIGVLSMIPNFLAFLLSPVLAAIADRYESWQGHIFVVNTVFSALLCMAMLVFGSFAFNIIFVFLISAVRAPLIPMIDARTIGILHDKTRYGEIRLYGALSFGLMVLLTGWLITNESEEPLLSVSTNGFKYVFYLHLLFSLLSGFIVIFYPIFDDRREIEDSIEISVESSLHMEPLDPDKTDSSNCSSNSSGDSDGCDSADRNLQRADDGMMSTLLSLIRSRPDIISFIAIVFLSGVGDGVIDAFLFLRLKELGGSGIVMGVGRFITCMAEIPMFHLSGMLQEKFGTYPLLAVTQFAFVFRFCYYAALRDPWWVLPCETLNGVTFAVTWSTCCTYASSIAPKGSAGRN